MNITLMLPGFSIYVSSEFENRYQRRLQAGVGFGKLDWPNADNGHTRIFERTWMLGFDLGMIDGEPCLQTVIGKQRYMGYESGADYHTAPKSLRTLRFVRLSVLNQRFWEKLGAGLDESCPA